MATSQDVINAAYLRTLGRPADPEGLAFYSAQLEAGRPVGDILADLNYAAANQATTTAAAPVTTQSDADIRRQVEADVAEFIRARDAGESTAGIGFSSSTPPPAPPPAATEPLTAQGLYNQFLGGRPALEKDLKFWNDYIAQYGPDQAMAAFDAAAEQERNMDLAARAASLREQGLARDDTFMKDGERTVREGALTAQGLYNEYLGGRSALPADIDFWNNYIAVYGPDKARAAFQESAKPELSAPVEERLASLRAQNLTVPGSLLGEFATQRKATPAEVRSMYLSVLGREPDPEGFSYYTSQPIESLRQNFYQASIPEMEKRVKEIPVTTTIPKPVIGQVSPQSRGQSVDIPGSFVTTNQGAPKPLTVDISTMPREQQDLTSFIVGKMPRPTTTAPSMFSPENVAAQLELERLRLQPTPEPPEPPEPPAETPVAGFAQGGLVSDDINRMLQNQRNAVMRESQSRQMLTNLGAPPVKKFSDGGPAGSSSGVRRLEMSGYQEGGDVTDEMFVGTRPEDFPETSPVDTAVSDFISSRSKLVTDPQEFFRVMGQNIEEYHGKPLREDPQKYLTEQLGPGQGLMGAIKPKGGIMPTAPGTPWGEYIDEVLGAAQKNYANIADDRREGVVDFIKKKLDKYIRSDFGTEEDPLRRAVESGRLETFGKDKDTFRSYALKAAREGDPDAVYDVTKAYDTGTGIRPTVMLPTRDFDEGQLVKQKAVNNLVSKIVAEGGDPEIARSIVERQLRSVSRDETDKALQTGEEGYSKVLKTFGVDKNRPKDMGFFERALDQGDVAYGKDFLSLQFLRPQDLAEALGAIPSNKLASMDFPEAVVEGNRLMKKSRDLDENIKIAEKGKGSTLPKEILFFGTKPLKTPAKSGQWINITDPDAARLEGALMRHSVHGYGKDGPYSLGGKQALLSGKANLFSLRDEKGIPMVTVEIENMAMQKMSDREARKTPDFKVRQVQGKFNSAPEDYIDDVFDLAETINGRWSEGPAGNQRYGRDRSGKDLDEPKIIEWGKLFANRKAQGKAAGGEITKFIKDNR